MESHETSPTVCIASKFGIIHTMNVDDQGSLNDLANYHLTSSNIVYMKLMPNSNFLIVIDEQRGFFLLKREFNNNDDVKKFTCLSCCYLNYSAVEANGMLYMLMMYMKNGINGVESSNYFCDYFTIDKASNYSHQMQTIQLNKSYSTLQFQYYDTNKYALGANMTDIDIIHCSFSENGKIELNVHETISTAHVFGTIQFTVNAASVLTYGSDGQICLWDKNSMRMVKSVFAHDKCSRGVKDAILDPLQR